MSFTPSLYKAARIIGIAKFYESKFPWLRKYVRGSGMRISYEAYMTLITFVPLITSTIMFVVSYNIHLALKIPQQYALLLSILISLITYLIAVAILIVIPIVKFRGRGELIDVKIPILQSYLATLALTGMSTEKIFLRLYELRNLIGIDVEFEEIAKSLLLRGEDILKALDRAIEITPNTRLATIFATLKGLTATGVGIVDYVRMSFAESLTILETRSRSAYASLSILIEVFISLTILLPIIILLVVLALFSFGGTLYQPPINPKLIVTLMTFILVPFISLGLLIVVDSVLSKVRP